MRMGPPAVVLLLAFGPALVGAVREQPGSEPQKAAASRRHITPDPYDLPALEALRFAPEHARFAGLSNWPPAETNPPADVLHYDLDLDFDLAAAAVSGTATITLVWGQTPDNTLRLDLRDLTVSSVRTESGSPLAFTQDTLGVDIPISPVPGEGDTVTVALDYGGHPSLGFYVKSRLAYANPEPEEARFWFPCRDVPWDKATLALHGRVPPGNTLVSNGVLDSTTVLAGNPVYHWHEDHPLATYLMAATISAYTVVTAPSTVTPLTWYVYPEDEAASRTSFQHVDAMVAFFDSTLVPYPFDKYAICESDVAGMELQSAILIGSGVVKEGIIYESITAHELAHQWFGDLVTLADWRHVWLNEGFASFYDAVWHEAFYGPSAFDDRMGIFEIRVEGWYRNYSLDIPVVDPPPDFLFSNLVYEKAAWVLRMLRDLVGRDVFDAAVTNYLTAHAFGNATTDDFRTAVEAEYGRPLNWFFDQWLVTGTGIPRFSYASMFTERVSDWVVQLDVTQVQTTSTIFTLPLEVTIMTTAGDTTVTGWIQDAHAVLQFPVDAEPLSVTVDPNNKMLGTATEGSPPVVRPYARLRAWPNPFFGSLTVDPGLPSGPIDVFDVRGRRVAVLTPAGGARFSWDGTDAAGRPLPSGTYFLRPEGTTETLRIVHLLR